MAATTITRSTWTNDTGTPAAPVGDGTIINNARLQEIYANIDALVAGAVTFGGVVGSEGFGQHLFAAGAAGANILIVRNTSAGTSNTAEFAVGNNSSSQAGRVMHTASNFTPSLPFAADAFNVFGTRPGGLAIGTINASGVLRIHTGNAAERARIDENGCTAWGTIDTHTVFRLNTAFTQPSNASPGRLLAVDGAVTAAVGGNVIGLHVTPTFVEAASGTHSFMAGALFSAPTITAGAAAVTTAATLYVAAAPSASGAANYAIYAPSGDSKIAAATLAATSLTMAAGANIVLSPGGAGQPGQVELGSCPDDTGAAGRILFRERDNTAEYVWCDTTGVLRIHTSAPIASNSATDTAGTVIGAQTSSRRSKRDIEAFTDRAAALAFVRQIPVYRFRYREGFAQDTAQQFLGILADETPELAHHGGQAFNPVSAAGYLLAAVQALADRVDALDGRLPARG